MCPLVPDQGGPRLSRGKTAPSPRLGFEVPVYTPLLPLLDLSCGVTCSGVVHVSSHSEVLPGVI